MNDNAILHHLSLGSLKHGVCRVCLFEKSELFGIFEEYCPDIKSNELCSIKSILENITSIQISSDDGFPEVVCTGCLDAAVAAFQFKKSYEQADVTLKSCINILYQEIIKIKDLENNPTHSLDTILLLLPENEIFFIERNNNEAGKNDKIICYESDLLQCVNTEFINSDIFQSEIFDVSNEQYSDKAFIESDVSCNSIIPISDKFVQDVQTLSFHCTMCRESFSTKHKLTNHKLRHPNDARHICRICNKSYKRAMILKIHMLKHSDEETCTCPLCGVQLYYKSNLKMHMKTHDEKLEYVCDYCGKKYLKFSGLKDHIRFDHLEDNYCFMCDECGTLLKSEYCLKMHTKIHNHKQSIHVCQYCAKTYHSERYYRNHLYKHESKQTGESVSVVPAKKFICDYCSEEYVLKESLKRHIIIVHLDSKKFKCEKCGKAFRSKGNLREHGVVHTRERLDQCDICGSTFVNKKALKLHQRLHTGERPYACNMCDEKFVCSSRRDSHVKSRHMAKQEECPICFRKYFFKSSLNQHMIIHSKPTQRTKPQILQPFIQEVTS